MKVRHPYNKGATQTLHLHFEEVIEGVIHTQMCTAMSMTKFCVTADISTLCACNCSVTSGLVQGVVASVSQQYAAMVSELLDMLQKTEQSLARVRRNKPADAIAAANGAELSNIQKISLQLFLDTQVCSCFQSCV